MEIPLEPRAAGTQAPLTASMLHTWNTVHERGARLSDNRMCATAVRIVGALDVDALSRSVDEVVRRHESLRTRIVVVEGIPRQQIDDAPEHSLEVVDLTSVSDTQAEAEARRLAQQFIETKIDLSVGPLFGARLLRLAPADHVLIVAVDHLVSDAASWVILSREIWTLYKQSVQALPFSLPPLPVQFADYALWQERARGVWLEQHEAYWRTRLHNPPRPKLPLDQGCVEAKDPITVVLHFPFGNALSQGLRDAARREATLLPLAMLSIYIAVMSRWCNKDDLVLGFMSHSRHLRPELKNMVGCVANRQLLRFAVNQNDSFTELSKRVHHDFYESYAHHDFDWVPELLPECTTEIEFNWQPTNWARSSVEQSDKVEELKIHPFPIQPFPPRRALQQHRLAPLFYDTIAGILMTVIYRPDLFSARTVERLGRNLRSFATEFVERPLTRIGSVPLERGE